MGWAFHGYGFNITGYITGKKRNYEGPWLEDD